MSEYNCLDASNLSKAFGGIQALSGAHLSVRRGEIHALLGENGSGKSTLSNIVAGRIQADAGSILKNGDALSVHRPGDAWRHGISLVAQDLQLNPHATVADNMALGRWPGSRFAVAAKEMVAQCRAALELIGADIDPRRRAGDLRSDEAQLVNIARGLLSNPDLLLLDEPTTALNVAQTDAVFSRLLELKRQGVALVFVSHRMAEVFEICDRATILRDGVTRTTVEIAGSNEGEIVRQMVGRELLEWTAGARIVRGEVLRVSNLSRGPLKDINFSVHGGEVLGIGGIAGSGRSALARTLAGLRVGGEGRIQVQGREVALRLPKDALNAGIALLPEDRKASALITTASILDNITLGQLFQIRSTAIVRKSRQRHLADDKAKALRIKAPSFDAPTSSLSGGNQQKVAFAKCLMSNPSVLILDEPTQGIDVGAKREIYDIIENLASSGVAIIVISSDMPELLALSDRIIALRQGRIVGEIDRAEATEESLLHLILGSEHAA
jgi:ABC-type sugar transport system ATPase subunit